MVVHVVNRAMDWKGGCVVVVQGGSEVVVIVEAVERDKEERELSAWKKKLGGGWFLYQLFIRGGKRDILSLMVSNLGP